MKEMLMLMTTVTVARRLGVTPGRVRQLANAGLIATERTAEGVRLYRVSAVERYARDREARRAAREAQR